MLTKLKRFKKTKKQLRMTVQNQFFSAGGIDRLLCQPYATPNIPTSVSLLQTVIIHTYVLSIEKNIKTLKTSKVRGGGSMLTGKSI